MCDIPEEDFAEYMVWVESALVRAKSDVARGRSERFSFVRTPTEPAAAEA